MTAVSSTLTCESCDRTIALGDINIGADVAKCSHCGHVFRPSERLSAQPESGFDESDLPPGVTVHRNAQGFEITATTRTPYAFFLVPFALVWSGAALGGIYGQQIVTGQFELGMSLFGIPFLLGSVVVLSLAAMSVFGKVAVRAHGYDGSVFIGVGTLGRTRRFSWRDVETVQEGLSSLMFNR